MEPTTAFIPISNTAQERIQSNKYQKDYTEFIDLATHDLDAPLRKLSMLIDRLTDKFSNVLEDKELQPYFQRIETCAKEMREIIDDLSVLSKLFSEKEKYESCNLKYIVKNVMEELQPKIKKRKAIITLSALPTIEGDPQQLKLLFRNLIENAIKFSKKDTSPFIRITSLQLNRDEIKNYDLQDDLQYYKIEIADNGIGFNQEYGKKIFQPFFRLHGKSKYPGTGIGLAICKKIVENHEGIIYAQSKENSGSCFVLILSPNR